MWWNREIANRRPWFCLSLAACCTALAGCGANDPPQTPSIPMSSPTTERSAYSGCEPPGAFFRNGSRDERKIALTFDDAPSETTLALAKVLSDNDARATFFVFGQNIGEKGGALRRLVADGSELGNHSFSHPNMLESSRAQIKADVTKANRAIADATGFSPCLFRAPYGKLNPALVSQIARLGMATIAWDVDPADWEHPGSAAITDRVLKDVRPGSIVVMHDSEETRGQTVAALPAILDALKKKRLETVTVSELLGGEMIKTN